MLCKVGMHIALCTLYVLGKQVGIEMLHINLVI